MQTDARAIVNGLTYDRVALRASGAIEFAWRKDEPMPTLLEACELAARSGTEIDADALDLGAYDGVLNGCRSWSVTRVDREFPISSPVLRARVELVSEPVGMGVTGPK